MTAEQKIERIKKVLEECGFGVYPKEMFEKELFNMTINDIKDDMWEFYCIMCDVDNIINM